MRAAGIPADAFTYEALAMGCGLAGDWETAEGIVREMVAGCAEERRTAATAGVASPPPSPLSSELENTAAAAVGPTAEAGGGEAAAVAAGGEREGGSGGSVENVPAAAAAAAGDSLNRKQRHRQRRRREQLENGVPPSPRVLHGLMEAYARAGEWERAQECLDDMLHGSKSWAVTEVESAGGGAGAEGQEGVGLRAGVRPDCTSVGWAIQVRNTRQLQLRRPGRGDGDGVRFVRILRDLCFGPATP